ncbi:DUF1450 domain-containing protein [Clostridium sp. MB05]|jgi:uncharacterized protein YuzB (UPF0349 family)|uniref:DUF1450 domain-containing protein n=1 Tax=Clostridium sp. MB05 TaxID=3376682 RepID=UPI0039826FB6
MISVCPTCSGIEIEKLEEKFGKDNIEVSCIGECGGRDGLIIAYANGKYIEAETEEEFIKQIEE